MQAMYLHANPSQAAMDSNSLHTYTTQGYEVTIGCRDDGRAANAVQAIKSAQPDAKLDSVRLDLQDLSSVAQCYKKLAEEKRAEFDVLLNNAGVMATPKMQTKDGFEYQLGVNHLGHFALTLLLLPHLKESNKPVRIINVSSMGHTLGSLNFDDLFRDKPGAYGPWEAYGQSKRANILFTYELARRLQASPQITANCLHPGVVRTELGRYMINDSNKWYMSWMIPVAGLFFKSPAQGAETSIYLASSPDVANMTGKYWDNCKAIQSDAATYDTGIAKKLWEVSEELVMPKLKACL
ncbi:NAD(P)-binding protein [Dunaliella salina]|uniref:NAD(P)-binding protein n=1 Tax=Dunaliella salina TaxID=3046 RepID=A0ABQ7GNH8_DUNSA|nr:NAD(P)-binding protein [Dunaliella salina]|eukprot:KAF5836175.1 NAD(P)-binding protein [Dunaliella salina]